MLDWLVSAGELDRKPVMVVNASPAGGLYAQRALLETLRTMNWRVVDDACLIEPFVGAPIRGELTDAAALETLRRALAAFVAAITERALSPRGLGQVPQRVVRVERTRHDDQ